MQKIFDVSRILPKFLPLSPHPSLDGLSFGNVNSLMDFSFFSPSYFQLIWWKLCPQLALAQSSSRAAPFHLKALLPAFSITNLIKTKTASLSFNQILKKKKKKSTIYHFSVSQTHLSGLVSQPDKNPTQTLHIWRWFCISITFSKYIFTIFLIITPFSLGWVSVLDSWKNKELITKYSTITLVDL